MDFYFLRDAIAAPRRAGLQLAAQLSGPFLERFSFEQPDKTHSPTLEIHDGCVLFRNNATQCLWVRVEFSLSPIRRIVITIDLHTFVTFGSVELPINPKLRTFSEG